MAIHVGPEIIAIAAPLLVTVPLYMLGRRVLFRKYQQSEMHLIPSGQLFTLAIFALHLALTVALFMKYFF